MALKQRTGRSHYIASQQLADPSLRPMIEYLSDHRLPGDEKEAREIDINDYKAEVAQSMQEAWYVARENIRKSQKTQK